MNPAEHQKAQTERILLGAMLRESAGLFKHIGSLNPRRFEHAANGLGPALAAVYECALNGNPVNTISIGRKVQVPDLPQIEAETPEVYLDWAVEAYNADYAVWAELSAQNAAQQQWANGVEAIATKLAEERKRLCAFQDAPTGDWKGDLMQWLELKLSGKTPDYPTKNLIGGFSELVPVFEPGDYAIIAARPGMGKTHCALNLIDGFTRSGAKGTLFSLEMTRPQLARRMVGMRTGLNPKEDWSKLSEWQMERLTPEVEKIMKMPLDIQDKMFTMPQMQAHAYKQKMCGELDFILLDYLQLIDGGAKGNRNEQLSEISRGIMRMASQLEVPVIALSQLSRDVEKRGGAKRPQLSDLRDSGTLEQDATMVCFLYRPEYYGILEYEDGATTHGVGEFIVEKQRSDATGTVRGAFNPIKGFAMLYEPTQPAPVNVAQSVAPSVSRNVNDNDIPF